MAVTDIGRQFGKVGLHVPVGLVPGAQSLNDKVVAQIMNAWAAVIRRLPKSNLVGQADEPTPYNPARQAGALLREQKALAWRMGPDAVAQTHVLLQFGLGGSVKGNP